MTNERYMRQIIVPEIGAHGQDALAKARVLIVGAGGLGCSVLPVLVGAGVGHITVMDQDQIELSNMHRQPLYTLHDIGASKAHTAADRMRAYNPDIEIHAHIAALTPSNIQAALNTIDVVIDAADRFYVTYTLSDECLKRQIPLISGSVIGLKGYVGGFCGNAPSYRALFPDIPAATGNCNTIGVLGSAPAVIGAMQAHFALSYLLQLPSNPMGKLVSIDFNTLRFTHIDFSDTTEPSSPIEFIAHEAVTSEDICLEIRDQEEAPSPAFPHGIRIMAQKIADTEFPKDKRIIVCCRTGMRAWQTAWQLQKKGHNVFVYAAEPYQGR